MLHRGSKFEGLRSDPALTASPIFETGHALAFEEAFTTHFNAIQKYAQRRLGTLDMADDVAAATFAAAWERWGASGTIAVAWLFGVAHNKVADAFREQRCCSELDAALAQAISHADNEPELVSELREALPKLDERDRQLLVLTYWERLTAAQVAEILDISVTAAWKGISRSRARLRAALAPAAEQDLTSDGPTGAHNDAALVREF